MAKHPCPECGAGCDPGILLHTHDCTRSPGARKARRELAAEIRRALTNQRIALYGPRFRRNDAWHGMVNGIARALNTLDRALRATRRKQ